MNNKQYIQVNAQMADLCDCCFMEYNMPGYDINCIFNVYKHYINVIKNNSNTYLLIFIGNTVSGFTKLVHYAYIYRKQENLFIPNTCINMFDKSHYMKFLYFLIDEYIEENIADVNDKSLQELKNPLYKVNPKYCAKDSSNTPLFKNIIVIPDTTF